MAQTLSTNFDIARRHRSNSACFIVHFQAGSRDLYLSTRPVELPDSSIPKIEEGVKSFSPIAHGVDVYTFRYRQNSVRIVLSSGWPRRTSDGSQYTYSDDLGYLIGHSATVYLYPGGAVQALTDCLEVFSGQVTKVYTSADGIEIECDALALVRHRDLPQVIATRADYPNIPPEHDGLTFGVFYGERYDPGVNATLYAMTRQDGLMLPVIVSRQDEIKYIVASHAVDGVDGTKIYIYIKALDAWSRSDNVAATTLDSGNSTPQTYATIILDVNISHWQAVLVPSRALPSSTATDNPIQATDHEDESVCNVIASSTTYADVIYEWTNQGAGDNDAVHNALAEIGIAGKGEAHLSIIRDRIHADIDAAYLDVWDGSAWVNFSSDLTWIDKRRRDYPVTSAGYDWIGANGIFWHLESGPNNGDGLPTAIRIRFENSSATWTADSTEVATIEDISIFIMHRWPRGFQPTMVHGRRDNRGGVPMPFGGPPVHLISEAFEAKPSNNSYGPMGKADKLAVGGSGRVFQSWIDSGGRYSGGTGQEIMVPPLQIESILRDELGVGPGSIDTDSFDYLVTEMYGDVLSGSPMGFISLAPNSRVYSRDLIERYCWEWGMFLTQTRDLTLKVFDYELGLDVLDKIFPHDLVNGLPILETSSVSSVINKIILRFGKTEWDDAFRYTETVTDSSSTTHFNTRPENIDCEYLRKSVFAFMNEYDSDSRRHVDRLFDRLIGSAPNNPKASPECILSRPHAYVTLQTIGNKFAHAEPGDWITLDSDSFDPIQKFFGQSWADVNLMVVETEVTETMTTLKTFNWQPLPLT